MFFAFFIVALVLLYMLYLIFVDRLNKMGKIENLMFGIEISLTGVAIIAITSPNTKDNLFLYLEWIGIGVFLIGLLIFQRFYRQH